MKLEDIAKLAGVSRSTVSRVINNQPNVNENTRQKVLRVIQEQNFHPNSVARALVTRQTCTLSLVIPQRVGAVFKDPYFPTLIQSIIFEANRHGYAVMLWIGDKVEEETNFCQRVLGNGFFDGILITTAVDDDPLIPRLIETNFPFVLIGAPQYPNMNYVDIDNICAAQNVVAHLIRLGHTRIGIITGPLDESSARNRLRGYRQAMQNAGLPVLDAFIVEGDYGRQSGYDGMKQLLLQRPDAVFASNDTMASGALLALHEAGLHVPKDIAIAGFDDLLATEETDPPLTTVRQPVTELGGQATRMLVEIIEQRRTEPYQVLLPTQLIVRSSCGSSF